MKYPAEALSKIDEAKVEAKLPENQNDRRSAVRDENPALNQKATLASESIVVIPAQETQGSANADTASASAGQFPTRTHNSKITGVEAVQLNISKGATEQIPSRGRRPPTPYHPPSNLALTEISESSEEGDEVNQRSPVSRLLASIAHVFFQSHSKTLCMARLKSGHG